MLEKIYFLIIVQGGFLAVLLLLRRPWTPAGGWLAFFILLVSGEALQMYLLQTGVGGHVIGITQPLWFLLGPVIYHFARSLSGKPAARRRRLLCHFAPFCVVVVYMSIVYYPLDADAKQAALDAYIRGERVFETGIVNVAAAIQVSGYAVAIGYLLVVYRRLGGACLSNLHKLRLKSIGFLATLTLFTASLLWFNFLYPYLGVGEDIASPVIVNGIYVLGALAVNAMGIYALGRKDYLDAETTPWVLGTSVDRESSSEKAVSTEAAATSSVPSGRDAILAYMESKRPYLDSDFTIKELAEGVSMPMYRVSSTINREMGCNFFQFVNRYRVEAVKRVLDGPASKDVKLLAVAFDAGFNSKASFNSIFKSLTGMTPSQYRNRKTR